MEWDSKRATYTLSLADYGERFGLPREMTPWKNPLTVPARVVFALGPAIEHEVIDELVVEGRILKRSRTVMMNGEVAVKWAPGETVAIPSMWDAAIHRIYDGRIMGGLAPQMVRADGRSPVLDEVLRPGATGPATRGRPLVPD